MNSKLHTSRWAALAIAFNTPLLRVAVRIVSTFLSFQFGRAQQFWPVLLIWGSVLGWLHFEFWNERLPQDQWTMLYTMFALAILWTGLRKYMRTFTNLFEV